MRKYIWLSVIMLGIWGVSGCSRNDIVSPSAQSIGSVEQDEQLFTEYWDFYGTVTNVFGQPIIGAPIYIVVTYTDIDSTVFFLVYTDSTGHYKLENTIVRTYHPVATIKSTCIQSEPPEVTLTEPGGWDGDYYSVVDFRVNIPYCAPILE